MPQPGSIAENARPAVAWVSQVNPANEAAANAVALAGHTVEVGQPEGPRNPVMRALTSFAKLITRCFTTSQPAVARTLPPDEQAAQDTRTHLASLFRNLTPQSPGKVGANSRSQNSADRKSARDIAENLRQLASLNAARAATLAAGTQAGEESNKADEPTQANIASSSQGSHSVEGEQLADEELARVIEEMLDEQLPGDQALAVAAAFRSQRVADAQQRVRGTDPAAERMLMLIEQCVTQTVLERAYATMDRELNLAFDKIRTNELPISIYTQVKQAMGTAQALFAQLDAHRLLPTQRAEWIAQTLQTRITALAANPYQLEMFVMQIDPEPLRILITAQPANEKIAAALTKEVDERIPRLMQMLQQAVIGDAAAVGRRRANTLMTGNIENDISYVYLLSQAIIKHNVIFQEPIPDGFRTLIDEFEQQMAGIADARLRLTGKGTRLLGVADAAGKVLSSSAAQVLNERVLKEVDGQRKNAEVAVLSALDLLAAKEPKGRTAGYLAACKDVVTTVKDYLVLVQVPAADIADPAKFANEVRKIVASMPEEYRSRALAMLQVLGSAEIRTLTSVIIQSAYQALAAGLPELHAELKQLSATFDAITGGIASFVSKRVSVRGGMLHANALDHDTRQLLEEMCSTRIAPDGRVMLTAGRCSEEFTAVVKSIVEEPFSATEEGSAMLHGVRVPLQFKLDAERDGTVYLGPDGEPLIERKGWAGLDDSQKTLRIAAGYGRLLAFYGGNEQQTAAIVRLANQATTAGFSNAAFMAAEHSPLKLDRYGAGMIGAPALNTEERTTVRFFMSDNLRPQMELSYEVRGGRFDRVVDGQITGEQIYLDRHRSRARFAVTVEADAAHDKLVLIGAPTYDVHLVRSPIQMAFAIPKLADLFSPKASDLYTPLRYYAEDEGQMETSHSLGAMEKISAWQREPAKQQHALDVYDRHLRPDAKYPLPDTPAVRRARDAFEHAHEHTLHIFDAAESAARRRMRQSIPSDQAYTLSQFLEAIEKFKANPQRSVADAKAILATFPLALGSSSNFEVVILNPEAIQATYAAADMASRFVNEEVRAALNDLLATQLKPIAAELLPRFTATLIEQGKDPLETVSPGATR